MRIIITKTKDTMTPDLRRRLRKLQDPKPALKAMGTVIVSLAIRAFTDPSLRPSAWAPLSQRTLQQRQRDKRGSKPLLRTGLLGRSPRVTRVTKSSVHTGSDRKYAGFQQFGTSNGVPARPFFPFDEQGRPTAKARTLMLSAADKTLGLKP